MQAIETITYALAALSTLWMLSVAGPVLRSIQENKKSALTR
jgi:hypothetical protein